MRAVRGDGVWAVEYARGPLMLSMPFGLADELFSALDLSTAVQTLSMYTSLIGRHWANKSNFDYPLLVPFKKISALFMNLVGPAVTRALTPPPPVEINPPKPARRIAAQRTNRLPRSAIPGRRPAASVGTGGRPAPGPAAVPPVGLRGRPRG